MCTVADIFKQNDNI